LKLPGLLEIALNSTTPSAQPPAEDGTTGCVHSCQVSCGVTNTRPCGILSCHGLRATDRIINVGSSNQVSRVEARSQYPLTQRICGMLIGAAGDGCFYACRAFRGNHTLFAGTVHLQLQTPGSSAHNLIHVLCYLDRRPVLCHNAHSASLVGSSNG
jgi:hypothetical protein